MADRDSGQEALNRARLEQFVGSRLSRRAVLRSTAGGAAAGIGAGSLVPAQRAAAAPRLSAVSLAAARLVLQESGDSAAAAVAAANALDPKPAEIFVVWESALQAQDPINFSGPRWEELTGIRVTVIERPFTELFSSQVTEHIGATGGHDILSLAPAWQADFVAQNILEPLDPYIDQYMNRADLDDYHPLFRNFMNFGGQTYALFDDGDVIVLYYRRDLFEDAANMEAFEAEYGYPLAAPTTWDEYDDIQAFFTERGNGEFWGGASQRVAGGLHAWFMEEFRNKGGTFFNPETMDATVNGEAGLATLTRMVESNTTMPPGVETWGFIEVLTAWMSGQLAMIGGTWPPIGRWSEGTTAEQLAWVPETQVAGNVGYSVMPEGHSAHNGGFMLGVASQSRNKEAAYLWAQWATSPSISLERVMLPYALRDPYRLSHFASEEYRSRWATAGNYLDTLEAATDGALLDLVMPGAVDYHNAVDQAVTAAMAGTDPEEALAGLDTAWNEITDRLGRDTQREAYAQYVHCKAPIPMKADRA
ncbi:MAG: extracellular solute-binding protein [Chloroflexia bacterium]|nr:extracellular solute-binding protein [Chloroflexia bacterium]